jgi:NADPH:quinone reductase-like Zn-dependent oxidoreductase/NAD(P)-dependent dehydrogenase (short-subunit alcohol dehydrogenase family)
MLIVRAEAADERFASSLKYAVTARGAVCHEVKVSEISSAPIHKWTRIVFLPGQVVGDAVARVSAHCLALRDLSQALGLHKLKLYCPVDGRDRPAAEAVLSFLRTVANECPTLEIHRVEISEYSSRAADELAQVLLANSSETDVVLRPDGVDVARYAYPELSEDSASAGAPHALRLQKSAEGGLDRLSWRAAKRSPPGEQEIEVEVVATGLNFRDVMWSLSILPDEMLEDGFAGATLGLEFSGRVARVGDKVGSLKPGDDVVGFCGGAFSTHVTVDAAHVARLPEGVSCEAAATIPVAVLTAYYGLIFCADLRQDDWVLIHGGAGGVGLAALQIARWRGARIIVTAGTQEKRDLALALGAHYAFDSRSSAFVDDVRRVTEGRGVSVVLNSLAGEAMERSLGLLGPFGRFVELGKRDYLANTPVGLRPFRRNLSYFGVDLDQLLSGRPDVSGRLFREVLALFASGDLTPLPYTVFEGEDVIEAMRLMQQSGHIGKILVRPPSPTAKALKKRRDFKVDANRTHVITGGFGGFGLAAAIWLAERGARHLVLIGRSGPAAVSARDGLDRLERMGVNTRAVALDISDRQAALALFADLKSTMPPVAGVIHAAMVLDDAILANIDERRLTEVLRPKIAGAEIVDEAVRGLELDYFVLFSSATTVIGNPGQGAYVAANGYLEGLARRRVEAGLPALAISWGAIDDVGILASASSTKESLAARSGVKGMTAAAALDLMAEALTYEGGPAGDGVVVIADVNWSAARGNLPLLNSPTYAGLLNANEASDAPSRGVVDLKDLATRLSPELARRAVADIVIEELARILRLPRSEVSKSKPLSEIGLDSLMAVELMLSLESRFGLDAPIGASAGGFNVMGLSGHLLASLTQDVEALTTAESLASKHLDATEGVETAEFLGALQEKGVDLAVHANRQFTSAK